MADRASTRPLLVTNGHRVWSKYGIGRPWPMERRTKVFLDQNTPSDSKQMVVPVPKFCLHNEPSHVLFCEFQNDRDADLASSGQQFSRNRRRKLHGIGTSNRGSGSMRSWRWAPRIGPSHPPWMAGKESRCPLAETELFLAHSE